MIIIIMIIINTIFYEEAPVTQRWFSWGSSDRIKLLSEFHLGGVPTITETKVQRNMVVPCVSQLRLAILVKISISIWHILIQKCFSYVSQLLITAKLDE